MSEKKKLLVRSKKPPEEDIPFAQPADNGYIDPLITAVTPTEKGLQNIIWGFVVLIIYTLLSVLLFSYILFFRDNDDPSAIVRIGCTACGILILLIIANLLLLVGFIQIYSDKERFGRKHSWNVRIALRFLLFYIALQLVINYLASSSIDISGSAELTSEDLFPEISIIQLALGLIATILGSLLWIFLILELASDKIKEVLWAYLIMNVIFSILIIVIAVNNRTMVGVASGLDLIGFLMVTYCYWETLKRLQNKEIDPTTDPHSTPPPKSKKKRPIKSLRFII